MRIYVAVDMEGISGIVVPAQVRASEPPYRGACDLIAGDVNACVEGCFRGGATEVVVWDAHGDGFNIPWQQVDSRAVLQQGGNSHGRLHDIATFDALVLLGYHAMAGTAHAVLEHTMSSAAWQSFWINGRKAGEIAIDAGIAGDAGVPTILVSGDDACCREARRWIPGVRTAQVKAGLATNGARLLSPEAARRVIAEESECACRSVAEIAPLVHRKPVRMRLETVERTPLPQASDDAPWRKDIDARTFEVTGDDTRQALYRIL